MPLSIASSASGAVSSFLGSCPAARSRKRPPESRAKDAAQTSLDPHDARLQAFSDEGRRRLRAFLKSRRFKHPASWKRKHMARFSVRSLLVEAEHASKT
jgi:hypothetical protein